MVSQIAHIRTFLAIARHSGFAAAARATGVSPTIATRRIAELERQLGVQLFTRTTRSVAWRGVDRRRAACQSSPPITKTCGQHCELPERPHRHRDPHGARPLLRRHKAKYRDPQAQRRKHRVMARGAGQRGLAQFGAKAGRFFHCGHNP